MKRFLILAIAAITVLTACSKELELKNNVITEVVEKEKHIHPTWIGGKWYYLYY